MNVSCVICTDLFSPSSQILATKCGHLFHNNCLNQWIERAPNCPQCRQSCNQKNIVRLFMNVSQNESITSNDPTYLRFEIDELKVKITELNRTKEKIEADKNLYKESQKIAKKTIISMEQKLKSQSLLMENMLESESLLNETNKKIPILEKKLKESNEAIERMEKMKAVIECGTAEVNEIMKKNLPVQTLCQMVTVLKRELKTNEQKRTDLRNLIRTNQSEINKLQNSKKMLVEKVQTLESDNHKLESDIQKLKSDDKIDEKKENKQDYLSEEAAAAQPLKRKLQITTAIPSNSIAANNSPYLKIKSSSVVLAPTNGRNFRQPVPTGMSGFTIFKNPRVIARNGPVKNVSTVSNGMGANERKEMEYKTSITIPNKRCKLSD